MAGGSRRNLSRFKRAAVKAKTNLSVTGFSAKQSEMICLASEEAAADAALAAKAAGHLRYEILAAAEAASQAAAAKAHEEKLRASRAAQEAAKSVAVAEAAVPTSPRRPRKTPSTGS